MARKLDVWRRLHVHRWKLVDGSAVILLTLLAAFYAYEVDVFRAPGVTARQQAIELDEVMLVASVLCGGLVLFAMRRLTDARRETARRLEAEREARTLALHDPLTGLPNRRHFEEALRVAAASPPRAGASHALVMMDLNGFKRINDLFGHQAGDEVLTQVAGRLNRCLREGDLVARLGGDEFALLALQIAGAEAATSLGLRIMEALEPPIVGRSGNQAVGVAIGIALTPQDGAEPDELIRKADIALYRAKEEKHRSRSAMRFFEPAMDGLIQERDLLEGELRRAIAARQVRPHYQPLVALDRGAIVGFEALARWTSARLGAVPAQRFIEVAENCGLIAELTDLLLEQACADAATWPDAITLAFNASAAVLQDEAFAQRVLHTLTRSGVAPHRLEIEITESALVRDLEAARRVLGTLQAAGVRIALDDFGTGYSSLYHLRAFKPNKIKIDRTFIDAMVGDPNSAAIVQALIGLGSGLGATITAEGVETIEQRNLLRRQGCDQGQGHLFSEAVAADQALRLLAAAPRKRVA